jgi:hypothetical protein
MTPIRTALAAVLFSCGALAAPAFAAPAAAPARAAPTNAQEQAPEALLGVWKADVAASRYTGAAPRSNIRTFSYTQDGKVLVTSITRTAAGRTTMLHWAVQLDGQPGLEFIQANRSVPSSLVGLKKEDERTLVMTVWKHGTVDLTGEMRLSEDGATLTYSYGPPGRAQNVIVYRRWDLES